VLYGETQTHTIDNQDIHGFKVSVPYPAKTAYVRMPTSAEVARYFTDFFGKIKKGAEASTIDEKRRLASLELFKTIKVHGDDMDEYEADNVIPQLLLTTVESVEKSGGDYDVTLKTRFGSVTHHLRPMSYKERAVLQAAQDSGVSFTPAVTLYDALVKGLPEGYAPHFSVNDIPCDHKGLVINALKMEHDKLDPIQIEFDPIKN
jgi:hypothetical protein